MTKNQRIADFAAELIAQGRNPILALLDAMAALDPKPERSAPVVYCASHEEKKL